MLVIVRSHWLQKLIVLTLLVAISGCAVRFVYNRLDWVIPWYVDDYVDFYGEQEAWFERRLDVYLDWHRREQLPEYARFLEQQSQRIDQGLSDKDIEQIFTQTEAFAQSLWEQLIPELVALFPRLEPEQIQQIFDEIERSNQSFHRKYVAGTEQQQRAVRRNEVEDYVSRWTGKLSDQQLAIIDDWSQEYVLMGKELEQARLAWQDRFRQALAQRQNPEALSQALRSLITDSAVDLSESLRKKLEHNKALSIALYLQLDKSLSSRQRQRMVSKLRGYAEDFLVLSRQSG